MSRVPRVEITRVSPRDYPVNLALARSRTTRLRFFRQHIGDMFKTMDSSYQHINKLIDMLMIPQRERERESIK